ncbi:MAG: LEA type 2 family protein [Candidatus Altiarchaeota archaeon]
MDRDKVIILAVVTASLIAITAGFILWPKVSQPPEVRFSSARIGDVETVSLLGFEVPKSVEIAVELEVYNPNMISITVKGAEYGVSVNNAQVGKGSLSKPIVIPPGESVSIETVVVITAESGLKGIIGVIQKKSFTVRVQGEVEVEVPLIGSMRIPVDAKQDIASL